jgi:hypothetical protein
MTSSEEDDTPEWNGDELEGEDIDLSDALEDVEAAEQDRHRRGLTIGAAIAAVVILVVTLLVVYRDTLFEPELPVEQGEQQVIDDTDDPECRRMIAKIMNIRNAFVAMETRIASAVPDGDREAMSNLLRELEQLEARLRDVERLSDEANLRFDRSREELERWFEYVYNEFSILRNVIRRARSTLPGPSESDAGSIGDASTGDAGEGARDATSTPSDAGTGPDDVMVVREDVRYQRQKTLSALHDAFEKFRVWHESSSLHPCGSNEEGETPWRPEGWDGGLGGQGAASPDAGRPTLE